MNLFMNFFNKLKLSCKNFWFKLTFADRISRLERNYLVVLKRLLEMDGIKLDTNKFQNLPDEKNATGLNEYKPTIH